MASLVLGSTPLLRVMDRSRIGDIKDLPTLKPWYVPENGI